MENDPKKWQQFQQEIWDRLPLNPEQRRRVWEEMSHNKEKNEMSHKELPHKEEKNIVPQSKKSDEQLYKEEDYTYCYHFPKTPNDGNHSRTNDSKPTGL